MNTERPDHEDAVETATAGSAATARDAGARGGAAGPAGEPSGRAAEASENGALENGAPEKTNPEEGTPAGPERGAGGGGGNAGQGGGPGGEQGDGGDGEPGEGGGGRLGRGRSPLVAASVAAAVLLAGGGGAYLATSASGASGDRTDTAASGGHGTPPPLVLDDHSGAASAGAGTGGPGGAGGSGGANGIAPGEPAPYGTTYQAVGTLPGGPGSAPVYTARGEVTRDEAARLAAALGITGTPVADGQAWRVGNAKDGGGPVLRIGRSAPGTWTFDRYAPGTDDCKGVVCGHDPAAPAAHPVGVAAAMRAAAPVLKAAGQDDAKVDASRTQGAQRVVNADPVVGGLPTQGWATSLILDPQGAVIGGSGQLAAPVKADTYPVLDARRTLELMNAAPDTDRRTGIGGCAEPVPLKDRLETPCGASGPGKGTRNTLTVEKAVFGLAAHPSGGRQTLVPSWLFRVRGAAGQDAFTVTYPAVDPKYLASSGATAGQTEPRPSGSDPSGPAAGAGTAAPATREVRPAGYSAHGRGLTVTFEGGVCADYRVSAREDSGRVTVTVTETPWRGKVCIMIAKVFHRTVHLDRPLDGRAVVGPDGRAIPSRAAGAGLPQSGTPVR
nr:membrane protein [Streptomyces sp. Xyl84]